MAIEGKQAKTKHLSLILRVGIAILACWYIFKDFDIAVLSHLRIPTLLLAVGLFAFGLCLIGVRWWVFMCAQKIAVSVFLSIKLTFLGQFFTNFLPSAVGGDLVRAWYISRHTPKKLHAALGVAADRFIGLISTFILAAASYLLFFRGRINPLLVIKKQTGGVSTFFEKHPVSLVHVLLAGTILLGLGFLLSGFFDFKGVSKKLYLNLTHILKQSGQVLNVYFRHPFVLFVGLGMTLFLQSMVILSLWLIGRDLGMPAQIQFYFLFFPMMWVIGALPLSIAGLGIVEGGLVLLFVHFTGAEEDAAKALALCQRLTWILASLPGMVVHLTGTHRAHERKY